MPRRNRRSGTQGEENCFTKGLAGLTTSLVRSLRNGQQLTHSDVRSPDLTKDPNFKIPETYEELIARAEAEMASEDKSARYGPPVQKGAKTNKKLINEY